MIAVDANLLVHAHREDSRAAEIPGPSLWSSPHEFLAIVTHPRIYDPPTPQATAFKSIKARQNSPGLHVLQEGPGYLDKLERLCVRARVAGGRLHDARIAAICRNRRVAELWTAERRRSSVGSA